MTLAHGIMYPLDTRNDCMCTIHVAIICTICLMQYSLHCAGSMIAGGNMKCFVKARVKMLRSAVVCEIL